MKTIDTFQLKRPLLVLLIGCCFILAAPVNLGRALFEAGNSGWYLPGLWYLLFIKLPVSQRVVIALLPCAGVALFLQRKTSWLFAILILVGICGQNLYCYFAGEQVIYPLYVPLTINCGVLVIFYFFRFPYLDKRDRLFRGISKRYALHFAVQVDGVANDVSLVNLSDTGCFLSFKETQVAPEVNATLRLCIDGDWIEGKVVRRAERGCGIQFIKPSKLASAKMQDLIARFSDAPEPKARSHA